MITIKKQLIEFMSKHRPQYEFSKDDIEEIASHLASTIERLHADLHHEIRDERYAAIIDKLNYLGDSVFTGVNGHSHDVAPFYNAVWQRALPTRNGKSIHLELGAFNVWPEARAARYVAEEQIGDVIRLDMRPQFEIDVAGSVTAMPFADESIDRIYSNSLFEHVPYPHEIIRESYRVLRPGGFMLTVVPFHFVQHGCPGDFLRYTGQFFEQVGEDAGFTDILTATKPTSGVYYTTHQLLKAAVAPELGAHPMAKATQISHVYSLLLLASLQTQDNYHLAEGASCWHTTFALMSKPGKYEPRSEEIDRSKPFLERFKYLICPQSGLPLKREDDQLISVDGRYRYPIVNGTPNLFVMHGFNSSFTRRESSKRILAEYTSQNGGNNVL